MNITLKPEQEIVVQNLLAQGEFQTVDEVINAALALLETERLAYQAWLVDTRAKVEEGIAALERGEVVDGETFVNQLRAKLQQAREAQ
ncbi:ribbon-helix-helix domain-containing protein [Microseira wollei]|uniref:Transcriptional regulators, CopG/Arc/MetJ family protein n=1 Tax=Microseira wollei NIES-4236 TaxID=2530354 RepID=A0AAV3XKH7_9CYAN|nr:type II toxin-antitoxin system ParD family antitoxin [Microseira wollei]GET40002.1 putative transcriptional regulators, CopG/Arc/MetJ family protein [Microseira wollei NIES-4236]